MKPPPHLILETADLLSRNENARVTLLDWLIDNLPYELETGLDDAQVLRDLAALVPPEHGDVILFEGKLVLRLAISHMESDGDPLSGPWLRYIRNQGTDA